MKPTIEYLDADIWICQGPPTCDLDGDFAVQAQKKGCPWCEKIYIDDFGKETVIKPGEA